MSFFHLKKKSARGGTSTISRDYLPRGPWQAHWSCGAHSCHGNDLWLALMTKQATAFRAFCTLWMQLFHAYL